MRPGRGLDTLQAEERAKAGGRTRRPGSRRIKVNLRVRRDVGEAMGKERVVRTKERVGAMIGVGAKARNMVTVRR